MKEIMMNIKHTCSFLLLLSTPFLLDCSSKKRKKCCKKTCQRQGPPGKQGPAGPQGPQGIPGESSIGKNYVATYALLSQQSGSTSSVNVNGTNRSVINAIDSVIWDAGIIYADGWSLTSSNKDLTIILTQPGLFAVTYTVNASTDFPFVSYLTLTNSANPSGVPVTGSQLSLANTQSPNPGTVTSFIQLPAGQNTLNLIFNGAITPQNSTSVTNPDNGMNTNNATRDVACVSAAVSIVQIGY